MDNTTVSRPGNLQRAEWRQKCRQILSDHLKDRLGIVVEPAQVRLMPDIGDGYMWAPLPEKEHLFKKHLFTKQLSKHSIGVYMELCRGVGASFEAVAQPGLNTGAGIEETVKASQSDISFTSKINDLQAENTSMMAELGHLREQAQADSAARRHAEEKLKQSQRDLCAARMYINQLQQQNVKLSSRVRRLEKRMGHYDRGLKKINLGVAEIGLSPANPQRR